MIMENEQMKFNLEEPTSEYYVGLRKLNESVNDLTDACKRIQHWVTTELDKCKELEAKKEADLAVEKAYKMFVEKPENPSLDECFDQECPVDEKVFDKEQTVDDFSILNIIPPQAKKWVDRLTINEMIKAIDDTDDEEYATEDEYVGDLVDRLKDMSIAKYTNDILEGRVTKIEDEEIRSEVVYYMNKKNLKIPDTICASINKFKENKASNLDKIIERLDKGCEIKLDEDTIDAIVKKLWKERDNVSIKIHNNKISLR